MKRILIAILASLILMVGIVGCTRAVYVPAPQPPAPVKVLVPQSRNLIDSTITVGYGNFYGIIFETTSNMEDVKVSGRFISSGWSGNDIQVMVLDDSSYINWVNSGNILRLVYNSGRVTTQVINATIVSPGVYWIVFNNRYSILTSKDVSVTVNLNWSEWQYR